MSKLTNFQKRAVFTLRFFFAKSFEKAFICPKATINMPKEYAYPTRESVMFTNEIVNIMSNKKADQHKLLKSANYIDEIIEQTKQTQGDLYDKAAALMHGLITTHGFASGNKRTGFIVTVRFLKKNGGRIRVKNFNKVERIITNIKVYDPKEIAIWLRIGEIDETKIEH